MADPDTPDTPPTGLTPTKTPVALGLAPTSLDEGWRLAQMMARSELVPKAFRHKPEDVLVAIQLGTEIGLAPMQSLQSVAVINGRPSLWGDGFLALIMASPLYRDHDEYFETAQHAIDPRTLHPLADLVMARVDGLNDHALKDDRTAAVCTFWRRGKPEPVTRRFSIYAARKAGLFDKKDTPWITYPDRMLLMRARSWAGRDCFPDLLRGIRTAEEALDERELDAPIVREVRRVSDTPRPPGAAPTPEPPADSPTGARGASTDTVTVPIPERLTPSGECVHPTPGDLLTADDIPWDGR